MNEKTILTPVLIIFSFRSPSILHACAVCFSGTEETLLAFYLTTVILIVLPMGMVLTIIIWIYRQRKIS